MSGLGGLDAFLSLSFSPVPRFCVYYFFSFSFLWAYLHTHLLISFSLQILISRTLKLYRPSGVYDSPSLSLFLRVLFFVSFFASLLSLFTLFELFHKFPGCLGIQYLRYSFSWVLSISPSLVGACMIPISSFQVLVFVSDGSTSTFSWRFFFGGWSLDSILVCSTLVGVNYCIPSCYIPFISSFVVFFFLLHSPRLSDQEPFYSNSIYARRANRYTTCNLVEIMCDLGRF